MRFINSFYFKIRNGFSCSCPVFYNFCEKRKSFFKFILAGCVSGGLDLIVLFLLYDVFDFGLVLSTSIAFIFSFISSFILQKIWTFRNLGQKKVLLQLATYFLNAFLCLNLNGFLMHFLVNKFGLWYLLAQLMVNFIIGFINFLVYKFIIFKKKKNENTSE